MDCAPRGHIQCSPQGEKSSGRSVCTIANALKHARASEFEARLSFDAEAVRLELRDNGVGFLANQTNGAGFGLIGMRERTDRIGGTLTIASEPGAGTTIIAVSPYEQAKL